MEKLRRKNTQEIRESDVWKLGKNAMEADVSEAQQQEDAALKITMKFFAEDLLPYLGIKEKVVGFAPTELVQLEIHKLYEDFNLVMEDNSWKHFEFQSTNEGLEGLKRFRSYEALSSYQNRVPVTTYVLFSGRIHHPMTEFTEGINTYRVVPIIMQDRKVEKVIEELEEKVSFGEPLIREDLLPLALLPLMGGEMDMKERIKMAYTFTRRAVEVQREDIRKMEAVIYAMADKFLEPIEMDELMEEISMTKLGQKLVDKGRREGMEEGIESTKLENARNLLDILDEHLIADRIGLPLETVQRLKKEAVGK